MSAPNPARRQPIVAKGAPPAESASNPFDTIFDGEDKSDDEWWDEEESIAPEPAAQISHAPRPPKSTPVPDSAKLSTHKSVRRVDKRYSVQKPKRDKSKGRQRKQNALAGIKVITNFSKSGSQPAQLQQSGGVPQVGRFIDLAALQALDGEQSRSQPQAGCFVDLAALQALDGRPSEASGALATFWRSRKNKDLKQAPDAVPYMSKDSPQEIATHARHLEPGPHETGLDLSPSDRPIFIGISVPSERLAEHSLSPQTAISNTTDIVQSYEHRTPQTPSIVITPAHAGSIWSALDDNSAGSVLRPASSIFSTEPQNSIGIYAKNGAPPVPRMPAGVLENERQRIAAQKSYFSPDSEEGTSWEDEDEEVTSRSRAFSTGTVFEEDESPVAARTFRAATLSASPRDAKHASISTVETQRRSKGWWNYILNTPFISRSNTATQRGVFENQVPPPAMPDLAVAAAKAQEAERDREGRLWEKQFSPLTPETTTTTFSDSWWDISAREDQSKHPRSPVQGPQIQEARHKAQPSDEGIRFVISQVARLGDRTVSTTPTLNSDSQLDQSVAVRHDSTNSREAPVVANQLNSRNVENTAAINPYMQPTLEDLNNPSRRLQRAPARREALQPLRPAVGQPALPTPPPPYSPPTSLAPRNRSTPPVLQARTPQLSQNLQYPASPGPMTPGLQQVMGSRGAIPMSEVPLTPAPIPRRPIGSQYPELPLRQTPMVFEPPPLQPLSSKAQKGEAKRRRYEKEDAVARRAGGWWRGRGCIPERGCYGKKGAEGRKRRRCYCGLIVAFLTIIILAVVLATTLHRKANTVIGPSQWLNLTGFPPIFTGLSTVAAPANTRTNTGCVVPSTEWSCDLPKELQGSVAPNASNQPNFLMQIQWDNSSATNATFENVTGNPQLGTRALVANPVSASHFMKHILLKARQIVSFAPNPAPPSFEEEFFIGNTTDGIVSVNKAGEPTPFYISFLSPTGSSAAKRELPKRDTSPFPNVTEEIPPSSINSDGSAQPANLLPLPSQQPIRLYDRGLPTEHYGFFSYFDRSIFLKSISTPDASGLVPADQNGGCTASEAAFRCTWAETRFLVQMWTRRNTTARLLNSTSAHPSNPAADFTQPGSFPYPITITVDRHGGDSVKKMLYCYALDVRGHSGNATLMTEARDFGGTIINPAANLFFNASDPSLGGFDGGTSGCSCQWSNFVAVNS